MYDVSLRESIRNWVIIEGKSQKEAAKEFRVSRDTVAKLLAEEGNSPVRQYHRTKQKKAPKTEAALPQILQWLEDNERYRRWSPKQQWTAHHMWSELRSQGIDIAESTVRLLVRKHNNKRKPAYVPLEFAPGERAEFDFGEATIELNGQLVKRPYLAGRLRYSGVMSVEFFPTQRQDAFLLGQQHAFTFWSGVPRIVVYDNLKAAVLKILQGHNRLEQDCFRHFHTTYGFEALFANVRSGWEKGSVENLVGFSRRNFMVPYPKGATFADINARLLEQEREDQNRVMASKTERIAERFEQERAYLGPLPKRLPAVHPPIEAIVRSTGRVRFETNDYSVPTQYAYQTVTITPDPWTVTLWNKGEMIAQHERSYARYQVVEDWRHYVELLKDKPFAVPWASPLRHGDLPATWEQARQELARRRVDGNREFVRILELAMTFSIEAVDSALAVAREREEWDADTVRHLTTPDALPPSALDPARYPEYQAAFSSPDLTQFDRLLETHA